MEGEHTPLGAPQPVEDATSWLALFGAIGTSIVALGGTLILISTATTRTRGASRSARLEWEKRQAEIQRTITPPPPLDDRS